MDETTLIQLEGALAAAPDNAALRAIVGRGWLALGRPARALAAIEGPEGAGSAESPDLRLLRARALVELDRAAEARGDYEAALAGNPALEDVELAQRIAMAESTVATRRADDDDPESNVIRLIVGGGSKIDDDGSLALAPERPTVTFADVGGLEDVKEQVRRRIILPFLKPSIFERFKRKAGGGILLYGPPGCGKTLMARATAGECQARFFNVAISDVLDMYIGESEAKLHALFEKARSSAPAVLFFDEIEALGGKRSGRNDSPTLRLVSQFLAEMDGFAQANAGVLVLGATNLPWAVDAAFRRPGRFDRFVFVPPPDRTARESILGIHLRERPGCETIDAAALAKRTPGFSGADLEGLVDAATDAAIDESLASSAEVPLAMRHFDRALKETKPTTLEWLTTARNHARYANEGGQYDDVLAFLEKHGDR